MENNNKDSNILTQTFGDQKRWVNWRYKKTEKGKITKVPYQINGYKASSIDSETWSTYEEALRVSPQVGLVFEPDQLLLGIDLDHCLEEGVIIHEQKESIEQFIKEANTYMEFSPSKTGLHLILKLTASLQLVVNKHPPFEVYTSKRFFTVTNNPLQEALPVRTVTPYEAIALLSIIGYPWGKKKAQKKVTVPVSTSQDDTTILSKMFASKNGDKIKKIYQGDITGYPSDSEADLALCSHLAYWTGGNAEQIDRLWLNSPLGARGKTQTRKENYRDITIKKAIDSKLKSYFSTDDFKNVTVNTQEQKEGLSLEILESRNFKTNFQGHTKEVSYEIAKYLIKKYHVKTIGERIRDIYIYKDGIYVLGLNNIKAEIQEILEELATTNNKNNIIEMIKDSTLAVREDFDVDKNFINLNNGIFNVKTKEFIPHNPEYLFFTKIPVNYDVNATCPIVEKFLNEILPEEYTKVILEWFGYCLYRNYFIKKAIIFVGEKDTGKSTLIKLFGRFMGGENTSGVSLQKIASDKFASSHLYNKHINVFDDLSFKDINDNGLFKIATGGGIISGEKKFGEQFQFQSFSKLTFACNKIPDVKDTNDDAYFSRWIIVPFLAEITKVDKFLTDKMTTEKEISGLLNLALLGLSEILQKQDFSYDKTPEEIKKEMLLSGSMVANFVKDYLEEETGAWVSKDAMYEECARYAKLNNLPIVDKGVLGRKLPNHSGYIIDGTKTIDGKQMQGWKNVKIKGKEEKTE